MPETTDNYHRIPVSDGHSGHKIRTMTVSAERGIKALYCVDCKKIVTYLFDVDKWTMEAAREWVEDHKGGSMTIRKTYGIEIKETSPDGGRIVISTAEVDRDRDRVLPAGGRFDNYQRNPVVQWGHNYRDPWATIGRARNIDVKADRIEMEFELRPPASESDPQHVIRLLWEGGWINAASIGFNPLSSGKRKDGGAETPWVENEFGGRDFPDWELLEVSLVPIPSNQGALRLAAKALDGLEGAAPYNPYAHLPAGGDGDGEEFDHLLMPRESDGEPSFSNYRHIRLLMPGDARDGWYRVNTETGEMIPVKSESETNSEPAHDTEQDEDGAPEGDVTVIEQLPPQVIDALSRLVDALRADYEEETDG